MQLHYTMIVRQNQQCNVVFAENNRFAWLSHFLPTKNSTAAEIDIPPFLGYTAYIRQLEVSVNGSTDKRMGKQPGNPSSEVGAPGGRNCFGRKADRRS
jgi:hypothetical protein